MIIANATVNFNHLDGTMIKNVRVSIQPASVERINTQGGIIGYEVHVPPSALIVQGDTMTVLRMYGHPVNEEVATVTVTNPVRIAGLIPYTKVEVWGVYL